MIANDCTGEGAYSCGGFQCGWPTPGCGNRKQRPDPLPPPIKTHGRSFTGAERFDGGKTPQNAWLSEQHLLLARI